MVGSKLGKYRIVGELGKGGMGVVYAAEHETLGKRAAVKVINPDLSRNQEVIKRFFAEAVAAARVDHAGITEVYDYGEDEATGCAYFVMELLEGQDLSSYLARRGMMTSREVALIGEQIADVLTAAHRAGIVHRDLKPDNIFLVPDRMVSGGVRVKVLDFGVAKLTADKLQVTLQTKTGSVFGTPHYMSPEQSHGAGNVDFRSDIYALGCVLFEMACGEVPFPGTGLGQVLGAHQHLPPPRPRDRNPAIDPTLEEMLLRMLAKKPDERIQTMREVADALASVARNQPVTDGNTLVEAPVGGEVFSDAVDTSDDLAQEKDGDPSVDPTLMSGAVPVPGSAADRAASNQGGAASGQGGKAVAPAPSQQAPASRPKPGPPVSAQSGAGDLASPPPARPRAAPFQAALDTLGFGASQMVPGGGRRKAFAFAGAAIVVAATIAIIVVASNRGDGSETDSASSGQKEQKDAAVENPDARAPVTNEPPLTEEQWVEIQVVDPPLALGLPQGAEGEGFSAGAIQSPTKDYSIQKHEVSWEAYETWLGEAPRWRPEWVPAKRKRLNLPVVGIPRADAEEYCRARGGRLPTEEEWEYAARAGGDASATLRPHPWGADPIDPGKTTVFRGKGAHLSERGKSPQDVTPTGIHDLAGNAQEWTAGPLRGEDGAVKQFSTGDVFAAIRGLPAAEPQPEKLPGYGAAYRVPLCVSGTCRKHTKPIHYAHVGFRCVK